MGCVFALLEVHKSAFLQVGNYRISNVWFRSVHRPDPTGDQSFSEEYGSAQEMNRAGQQQNRYNYQGGLYNNPFGPYQGLPNPQV